MADSIRDALTQAFADDEAAPSADTSSTPTPDPTPTPSPAPDLAPPTTPIGTPGPDTGATKTPGAPAVKPTGSTTATAPAAPVVATDNAPASWKAAEKAGWASISPEGKAAILRREQETQRALSASAEARKFNDGFQKQLHPYRPLLDAYGVKDPMQAIIPLLNTRAALEIGTDEQKAELISNLVYQFGIDIQKLDGYLSRGPGNIQAARPQQAAPAFDPRSMPELAPIFAIAEQFKAAQEAKIDTAIGEIAVLPEFEAMREDIADILDLAASKGRSMTVKEAYDVAAKMHGLNPAPAQVATTTSQAAAILARSRKAASSVAGAPKGSPGAKPTTLRDSIVAAMEG